MKKAIAICLLAGLLPGILPAQVLQENQALSTANLGLQGKVSHYREVILQPVAGTERVDTLSISEAYFDAQGYETHARFWSNFFNDLRKGSATVTFDSLGLPKEHVYKDERSKAHTNFKYTWDQQKRLVLVRKEQYNAASLEYSVEWQQIYDKAGRLTMETRVSSPANTGHYKTYRRQYLYNKKGVLTSMVEHGKIDRDNELSKTIFAVLEDGKTEERIYRNEALRELVVKNKKGLTFSEKNYDPEGKLVTESRRYLYDRAGNEIKMTQQYRSGANLKTLEVTKTYQYDKFGNWTMRKNAVNGATQLITYRSFSYYD